MQTLDEQLLGIGDVAAELGCSTSLLRQMEQNGQIPPARRLTGIGYRVYSRREVEAIKAIRAARAAAVA